MVVNEEAKISLQEQRVCLLSARKDAIDLRVFCWLEDGPEQARIKLESNAVYSSFSGTAQLALTFKGA